MLVPLGVVSSLSSLKGRLSAGGSAKIRAFRKSIPRASSPPSIFESVTVVLRETMSLPGDLYLRFVVLGVVGYPSRAAEPLEEKASFL